MKKFIKLFAPILGVSTIAAIAAPMSSCSCSTCTITLTTDGNGTLSQTTLSVAKGTSFAAAIKKLKITANDGYSFNGWVDKDGKKFNTRKEITSNFSAKAVFEEGSVITGTPLHWNSNINYYAITQEELSGFDDLCMDLYQNKEYVFSFTVEDGHIPYRFGICYGLEKDDWTNFISEGFVVTLNNNTDITGFCEGDGGIPYFYIEFTSKIRSSLKTGDVITIKFTVPKSTQWEYLSMAPLIHLN